MTNTTKMATQKLNY